MTREVLYALAAVLDFTFAVACGWRMWQNHLLHAHARRSLAFLAALFLSLWVERIVRLWAALLVDSGHMPEAAAILPSWWFSALQAVLLGALVGLFFVLQTPRKEDERSGDKPGGTD